MILSLIQNWEHVRVRYTHLDHVFIHTRLVVHLLGWAIELLVLNLEVVELELLFLLVETHLLSWGLSVGFALINHLIGWRNLV